MVSLNGVVSAVVLFYGILPLGTRRKADYTLFKPRAHGAAQPIKRVTIMKIWVDGDACPKPIKEILFRLADRVQITVVFVANQWLHLPQSNFIEMIQVENGPDIADDKIAEFCVEIDLVSFGHKERQNFANALDKIIAQRKL